jgi:ACS family tartrate transporter-like MFS transporter
LSFNSDSLHSLNDRDGGAGHHGDVNAVDLGFVPELSRTGLTSLGEQTVRKVSRKLVPFLLLLYTLAYLDRVNVGFASLEMTKELHFSNEVYGFGAGIFFLGYWLLEIPGAVLVERWSARKWISRIMITWGAAAALTGLVNTAGQFYTARFILGVAEAGFFPGVAVYFTHWFPAQERAKAFAGLLIGSAIAQIIGSPLSAALLNIHWLDMSGWRWLLILEGLPAVLAGVWVIFYLPDRPKDAKWLTTEERDWLTATLEQEKQTLAAKTQGSKWRLFLRPEVFLLTAVWFLSTSVTNAFGLWLPKIVQGMSGFGTIVTVLVAAIPYVLALPFSLFIGKSSDRTGERRWHAAGCMFLSAAGFALSQATGNLMFGLLGLTLAAMGSNARQAPFWSFASSLLTGTSSAVVIATISSFGQLGSFFVPYIVGFLTDRTGSLAAGTYYFTGSMFLAGCLMMLLKPGGLLLQAAAERESAPPLGSPVAHPR